MVDREYLVTQVTGCMSHFLTLQLYSEALQHLSLTANNGRGSIMTWASGNGGRHYDDCNADNLQRLRYSLPIGAIDPSGEPCTFAEHCAALFGVVGASYIHTTQVKSRNVLSIYGHTHRDPLLIFQDIFPYNNTEMIFLRTKKKYYKYQSKTNNPMLDIRRL